MCRQILHEGKFKRFVVQNGWEFVERVQAGGIVVIIAVTNEQKLVLVEQFRIPLQKRVVEFPAGLANDQPEFIHESLEDAARRELLEETGFEAKQMNYLFDGPVSSASNSDVMSFFYAQGLKKISSGGGDETENIQVHVVPLAHIWEWLEAKRRQGVLVDPRIYAGLCCLKFIS